MNTFELHFNTTYCQMICMKTYWNYKIPTSFGKWFSKRTEIRIALSPKRPPPPREQSPEQLSEVSLFFSGPFCRTGRLSSIAPHRHTHKVDHDIPKLSAFGKTRTDALRFSVEPRSQGELITHRAIVINRRIIKSTMWTELRVLIYNISTVNGSTSRTNVGNR